MKEYDSFPRMGAASSITLPEPDAAPLSESEVRELTGESFDAAVWKAVIESGSAKNGKLDSDGQDVSSTTPLKVPTSVIRSAIVERELLPPWPEVQYYLNGGDSTREKAAVALGWLKKALVFSSESKQIKTAAKQLLAVSGFTSNLEMFGMFDSRVTDEQRIVDVSLQDFCRAEALKIGEHLQSYYKENQLEEKIGKLVLPRLCESYAEASVPEQDIKRQDNPLVGVPFPKTVTALDLPNGDKSDEGYLWPTLDQESVYIHILRMLAMAIDPLWQATIKSAIEAHRGEIKSVPIKGDARMRNKMLAQEDHRFERKPRPAMNIDICRNCCTFDAPEDLTAAATTVCALKECSMLKNDEERTGAARIKNMFAFSEKRAAVQFYYRTLMLNMVYAPGVTYGDFQKDERVQNLWNNYCESPPSNDSEPWWRWRSHAQQALSTLQDPSISAKKVKMICETQLVLRPYLEARKKMHLLYKVVRADADKQLYQDFRPSKQWPEGSTYVSEQDAALQRAVSQLKSIQDGDKTMLKEAIHEGIQEASKLGHFKALQFYLDQSASAVASASVALYTAAFNGQLEAMRALMEVPGVDINHQDSKGNTALHAASTFNHAEVVNLLLDAGADPNVKNGQKSVPMYAACQNGHADVVYALSRHANTDLNATDGGGNTSFFMVCCQGFYDVGKILLEAGVDFEIGVDDFSPLDMCEAFAMEGKEHLGHDFPGHAELAALIKSYAAAASAKDAGTEAANTVAPE